MEPATHQTVEAVMRRLSQSGTPSSAEDCISQLRSLNLDDDFWMYDFKVILIKHLIVVLLIGHIFHGTS